MNSLSVSPDPDQPLMAVVILLKDTDQRIARIYNYKTKELKQELELHHGSVCTQCVDIQWSWMFCTDAKGIPAVAAFHPSGEYVNLSIIIIFIPILCNMMHGLSCVYYAWSCVGMFLLEMERIYCSVIPKTSLIWYSQLTSMIVSKRTLSELLRLLILISAACILSQHKIILQVSASIPLVHISQLVWALVKWSLLKDYLPSFSK